MEEFETGRQRHSREDGGTRPYTCMGCEAPLEVQYHSCPVCGAFDIRRKKWIDC